jgi:hypothetical protein
MSYEIGYAPVGRREVFVVRRSNAKEALKTVLELQASDEQIRHIKAPTGSDIGFRELNLAAEKEGGPNLGSRE